MRVLAATLLGYPFSIKRLIALTSIYVNLEILCLSTFYTLNKPMNDSELVALGNTCREENKFEQALACYAQAFALNRSNSHAWNNYGNVLRELGDPVGAIPFLQYGMHLGPNETTPPFNLAVAYLLAGDYARGWPQYEARWNFEHLAGLLPNYSQPRWTGQDLEGKTIFVISEQGLGDNIQFVRFLSELANLKAKVILSANTPVMSLFEGSTLLSGLLEYGQTPEHFDYWTPIMSIPGILGITLDNLPKTLSYITVSNEKIDQWRKVLGPKKRLRVGFCYSGRRDSWINRHKGMGVDQMLSLIQRNPNYDWVNLQMDASDEDISKMTLMKCYIYNDRIKDFADTAGLMHHLDVVISVDTAVAHLSGALGRPTWIPLNAFGVDWRWLLDRDDSPWYPSARLFRQPTPGDWSTPLDRIHQFLSWFKV